MSEMVWMDIHIWAVTFDVDQTISDCSHYRSNYKFDHYYKIHRYVRPILNKFLLET